MAKSEIPPSEALYPVPVVLVTCLDRENGRANAITIAWCGTVASNPPQISISIRPSRYSHALITKEKQFVVNVPSTDILKSTDLCGVRSGKDIDKFKACSFTSIPSSKIDAPMIKECPVNIECTLKDTLRLGSHDVFIGEIVAVHVDDGLLDRGGRIDYGKAKPFVFNGGEYWSLDKKIGFYGFSQK
jgi:flavin reductase (DIM6/NTAB) family NADH-FMN oxidoreductase RutF